MRPDLVVHMPDARDLVVDVKTPLDAYLEAIEAQSESRTAGRAQAARAAGRGARAPARLQELLGAVRAQPGVRGAVPAGRSVLRRGAGRAAGAVRHRLRPARDHRDALHAHRAAEDRGARLAAVRRGAERRDHPRARPGTVQAPRRHSATHLQTLGQRLNAAVEAYNSAVGSLERQVLPAARRFTELGVTADASPCRSSSPSSSWRAAPAPWSASRSRRRRIPTRNHQRKTVLMSIRSPTLQPRADELAGRVIAITGPTRGIGRAVALGLRASMARASFCIGRNKSRLEERARRNRSGGRRVDHRHARSRARRRGRLRRARRGRDRRATAGSTACCTTQACSARWRRSSTTTCRPGAG